MTLRHIDIVKSLCIVFKKSSKRTFLSFIVTVI